MRVLRHLLTAGIWLAAVGGAQGADLPLIPEPLPVELGSGWYLRGDIGISHQEVESIHNALFEHGTVEVLDLGFDSAPIFVVGIGYRFNPWLRADLTGEYRGKATFHGLDRYDSDPPDGWDATNGYSATKSEWVAMLNAYWDLFNWRGFTPYVGAGIGAAHNTISHFKDVNVVEHGLAYADDHSEWNFAWALHAGVGFEVVPGFTIDVAYRYFDLGDAQSGDLIPYDGTNEYHNPMHFRDITSHDVKLGFRWTFGPVAAEAPAPDLVRKN